MFSVNMLSVSVWVLGGILFLTAGGIVFWRIFFKEKIKEEKNNQNIGSVSKEFNDMIISLYATTHYEIIHNILIKNKFASRKYSIIPAIIFTDKNAFLLTNAISSKKYETVELRENNDKPIYLKGKKELEVMTLSKQHIKEIQRYLKQKFGGIEFKTIIPVIDEAINVKGNWKGFTTIKQLSLEEDLEKFTPTSVSKQDILKVAKHLSTVNIFKAKISANREDIRHDKRGSF